jgi:hypothetical protein
MEAEPRMDVSRPSPLRLAGFLLTITGALLVGVGATGTWVTVGVRGGGATNTAIPGLDIVDGTIALVCALVLLLAVFASRLLAARRARMGAAAVSALCGLVATGIAGMFVATVDTRFSPVDSERLAKVLGVAMPELERIVQLMGGFTRVGSGAWLALAGGLLGLAGGILGLRWAARIHAAKHGEGAGEPAPSDVS